MATFRCTILKTGWKKVTLFRKAGLFPPAKDAAGYGSDVKRKKARRQKHRDDNTYFTEIERDVG